MVVADDDEVTGEFRVRMGVAVKVADAVDECALGREEFSGVKKATDTAVMVARSDGNRDPVAEFLQDARKFTVLLPARYRDVVFYVPQEEEEVGIRLFNAGEHALGPRGAPALDVDAVALEARFDAHVQVGDDQHAPVMLDQEGRAVLDKMKAHSMSDKFDHARCGLVTFPCGKKFFKRDPGVAGGEAGLHPDGDCILNSDAPASALILEGGKE